jgi:mRNA interferase MazF
MQPGEIYLAKFPFGDVSGMKLRPVLLLTSPTGPMSEVLVAYISSVVATQLLRSDLILDLAAPEFRTTNLKVRSALRLHKLATIHDSNLARYLGRTSSETQGIVQAKLRDLLQL